MELVKFPRTGQYADFTKELRKGVNAYFKENNISRYANMRMKVKTIFMVSLYVVPYILMLTGVLSSTGGVFLAYTLMALGMSGVGLSIMHDANHGSYSKKKWVNTLLGNLINMAGGSAINWRLQHNVLHHSFTNIYGLDQDLNPGKLMRFTPRTEKLKAHNYQHLYAWFLYSLMTIYWVVGKDFKDLALYRKMGILKQEATYKEAIYRIFLTKALYIFFMIVLPIMILQVPVWVILTAFMVKHFIAGLILSLVFQPAHVIEETAFPEPSPDHKMEDIVAVHQLKTTSNFGNGSKLLTWLVGGLNFQIEHHLFPNICHVHYPAISKIVKETAHKYGLPYYHQPTFGAAIADHARMLKKLGQQDYVAS